MNVPEVEAYLQRIGATRPNRPDHAALRDLHLRHLLSVPFESLSIHLGEPIVLTETALLDKVVSARRGGFCYELNGLFAALLTALGFRVTLLAGRTTGENGDFGPPYDHLALRVETRETAGTTETVDTMETTETAETAEPTESWLVDVGFGSHSHYPLRLDSRSDQSDPGGVFRISTTPEGDLDVHKDSALQYRLDQRPRDLTDFEATCWWQQTSPESAFTSSPVCSRLTASGRVTLRDRTLTVTRGDLRDEHLLSDDASLLAAYHTHFGITLDRLPVRGA